MGRALAKISRVNLSPKLAKLFGDPPLVGNEAREDYNNLFNAIADAVKPADVIAWLYVRDITDLSWEIKRERTLKAYVIKSAHEEEVRALLMPPQSRRFTLRIFEKNLDPETDKKAEEELRKAREVNTEVKLWATDPKARRRIEKSLTDQGHDVTQISARALNRAADRIDAIDRRIASYELRRMAALRATEHYSETLARRLRDVSSKAIEGQFTEAAE